MLPGEEVLQSYLTSHPDDAQAAGLTRSTEQKKIKSQEMSGKFDKCCTIHCG